MYFPYIYSMVVLVATTVGVVSGHTQLYAVNKAGSTLSEGKYIIKSNMGNAPVTVQTISTDALRCRSSSMTTSGIDTLSVSGGTNVTFQYRHANTKTVTNIDVMSKSHFGPCTVYMALASSSGEGKSWFKIFEEGYDASEKKWCTNKVIDNNGKFNFRIPDDIQKGLYYVRSELAALHQATTNGVQLYNNCALIQVDSTGSIEPTGYAIPGIYTGKEPGFVWKRTNDPNDYVVPGPPLYNKA